MIVDKATIDADTRKTFNGYTLHDVCLSGLKNEDSELGIYAADADSYYTFSDVFKKAIIQHHGRDVDKDPHPDRCDFVDGSADDLPVLNDPLNCVRTLRIRTSRNISFRGEQVDVFEPMITRDDRKFVRDTVKEACEKCFQGYFFPLGAEDDHTPNDGDLPALKAKNRGMFHNNDRFTAAAGVYREWPESRAVFLYRGLKGDKFDANAYNDGVIWINEEDHMRVFSIAFGAPSVHKLFKTLCTMLSTLEKEGGLRFMRDPQMGYLTACPTNLGTGLRFSMHVRLAALGEKAPERLKEICKKNRLSIRGTGGENTAVADWVYDISNKDRLGETELFWMKRVINGIQEILDAEVELQKQQ